MAIGFGSDLGGAVKSLPQLDTLADEELPCDDPVHFDTSNPRNKDHDGPGKFYVKIKCFKCEVDYGAVYLICEKMVDAIGNGAIYKCRACDSPVYGMDLFKIVGRR